MARVLAVADFDIEWKRYAVGVVIDFADADVIKHLVSRRVVDSRQIAVDAAVAVGATVVTHVAGKPLNVKQVAYVEDAVTGVLTVAGVGAAALEHARRGRKSPRTRHRTLGACSNASVVSTFHRTMRSFTGHFDGVQLVVHGAASSANAFKVSVAVSAQRGNGYNPVDGAGNALPWTPVTFGLTNRFDPRNRGGGTATAVVGNASGSAGTYDLIEGDVPSDHVAISSLDRTDIPGADPLFMLRIYGTNVPAQSADESMSTSSNPWTQVDPDHYSGYWQNQDYTAVAAPTAASQWGVPSVDVIFMLRGVPVHTIAVFSDSIEACWVPAATVPQFGGNINGWPRRLVSRLNAAGIRSSFASFAYQGHKSRLFHERALNAVEAGGITQCWFKPWSINEGVDGVAAVTPALRRSDTIIERCLDRGIRPVVIQPWAGQGEGTAMRTQIDAWIAGCAAAGIDVFDARSVVNGPDNTIKAKYRILNVGGGVVDLTHLNELAQDDISLYAFNQRARLGLAA